MSEYIFDFNEITATQDEMIPVGTVVPVRMIVRIGGYGPDQMLTKSRGTGALYLNTMLIVTEGPYILRRLFHRFGIHSSEQGNDWVNKGLRQLRAALESARNILPSDMSEKAQEERKIASYKDFDGLEFLIKVGIEISKNPQYKSKNCIQTIITPDFEEYTTYKTNSESNISWPLFKNPSY
jgi:hypothetical protein